MVGHVSPHGSGDDSIEHSVWVKNWNWNASNPPDPSTLPPGVNTINLFEGKINFTDGKWIIDGLNMTPAQLKSYVDACHAKGITVRISLGGYGGHKIYNNTWDQLASGNVQAMGQDLAHFCKQNSIDGIDFDYEEDSGGGINHLNLAQRKLVGELINHFKNTDQSLQTSLCTNANAGWQAGTEAICDAAKNSDGSSTIDRINIMSYDVAATAADLEGYMQSWSTFAQKYKIDPEHINIGVDPSNDLLPKADMKTVLQYAHDHHFSTAVWDEADYSEGQYTQQVLDDYNSGSSHSPSWKDEYDKIAAWAGSDPSKQALAAALEQDIKTIDPSYATDGKPADLTQFSKWFDAFVVSAKTSDMQNPDIYYACPGLTGEALQSLCGSLNLTNYTVPPFTVDDQAFEKLSAFTPQTEDGKKLRDTLLKHLKSLDPQTDTANLGDWANANVFNSTFWTTGYPNISVTDANTLAKDVGATVPSKQTGPTWKDEYDKIATWAGSDPSKQALAQALEKDIKTIDPSYATDGKPADLTQFSKWFDAFVVNAKTSNMPNPDIYYACPGLTGEALQSLCGSLNLTSANYTVPPFTVDDQAFEKLSAFTPQTEDGKKLRDTLLKHLKSLDPQTDTADLAQWANANVFNSTFWTTGYPNISVTDANTLAADVGATVPSKQTGPTWKDEYDQIVKWAGSDPSRKALAAALEQDIKNADPNYATDGKLADLTQFSKWFDAFVVSAKTSDMQNPDIYYACPGLTGEALQSLCGSLNLTNYTVPPFTADDKAFAKLSAFTPLTDDGKKLRNDLLTHLKTLDPQTDTADLGEWAKANVFNSTFWTTGYPHISVTDANTLAADVGATVPNPTPPPPVPVNWTTLEQEANLRYHVRQMDSTELNRGLTEILRRLRQLNTEIDKCRRGQESWATLAQNFGFAGSFTPSEYEMYANHLQTVYGSCTSPQALAQQQNAAREAVTVFYAADQELIKLRSNPTATWSDWTTWASKEQNTPDYQALSDDDKTEFQNLLKKP